MCENEDIARKTVENFDFTDETSFKNIFTEYSIMILTTFYS